MFSAQKKTERMLLRMPEQMSEEVRMYASFEHRHLSDELRLLLTLGLEQKRNQLGEETVRMLRQLASTKPESIGPMSTRVNSRQSPSQRKTA